MSKPAGFDLQQIIRPNILALQPYRCARDDYSAGILLDANENALGPSISSAPSTSAAPANGSTTNGHHAADEYDFSDLSLNRYPDPVQGDIKAKYAQLRGFTHGKEGTFLGVGSDEIIDLLMRVTCTPGQGSGDKILVCPPTYGMYSVCAAVNDIEVIKCPLNVKGGVFQPKVDEINQILSGPDGKRIKLLFLTSPGNPTGTAIPNDTLRQFLDHPTWRGFVVVDEAYIDFTEDASAARLFEEGYENLVVMQTMSKGFGLAGIRMGISFQSPGLAQILANTKAPYSIGTPTASIALKALEQANLKEMHRKASVLKENQAWLAKVLAEQFADSVGPPLGNNDANWLLVPIYAKRSAPTLDNARAVLVYKRLAEEKGVVVRFRGNELGCEACIRITIGTKEECETFVEKLREVLSEA